VLGWIIWPLRDDQYSKLYLPLVGAALALLIRSIALQIYRARTGQHSPMHDAVEAHVALNHPPVHEPEPEVV
jgi:hypothetical protein